MNSSNLNTRGVPPGQLWRRLEARSRPTPTSMYSGRKKCRTTSNHTTQYSCMQGGWGRETSGHLEDPGIGVQATQMLTINSVTFRSIKPAVNNLDAWICHRSPYTLCHRTPMRVCVCMWTDGHMVTGEMDGLSFDQPANKNTHTRNH